MPNDRISYMMVLKHNCNISTESILYHKFINNICNVITASVIIFTLFISNISLTSGIILYAIAFIIYDAFGIVIDYIVSCFYKSQYSADINEAIKNFISLDEEEKEKIISDLEYKKKELLKEKLAIKIKGCENCELCPDSENCSRENCINCENSDYFLEYKKIEDEINLYKEKLNEYKQKKKEEEEELLKEENPDLTDAIAKLEQIKETRNLCPKELKKKYNKIIGLAEEFVENVKVNPNLSNKLNKTFNIYFRELLLLFDTYNEIQETDENNKEFVSTISVILDKFEVYIKDIQDTSKAERKMRFKINSNLLEESLSNDIKKEEE